MNNFTTKKIAGIAIFSALSFVFYMFLKFPIPSIFPAWLDMQFSDLPALIGGFAYGPLAGGIIIVIKCLLKMPFTSTFCVGEVADIIVGLAFVLPSTFIYKYHKTKKGAVLGMLVGVLSAILISILANWLVLIPFYATLYGNGDYSQGINILVGGVQVLYKGVNAQNFYNYYIFVGVLPFNALRVIVCAVLTYFVYKPISRILH